MRYVVDLNCDMGESFGDYTLGRDNEVIRYITSSNIACGFHASDPNVMERTVRLCREHHVMAGAHPGYPDLMGFGRRSMDVSEGDLVNYVIYQVGALKGFLDFHGMSLQHIKMHGALYNNLVNDDRTYLRIVESAGKTFGDIVFLTLGTKRTAELKKVCRQKGIRVALEGFPDRMYTDEGELLPRRYKEAVLKDPEAIARRAVRMVKEKGVESISGRWIGMDLDTMCIHGDNMESIEAAQKIREYSRNEDITIKPLCEFV
jgi:UPF0271 protein